MMQPDGRSPAQSGNADSKRTSDKRRGQSEALSQRANELARLAQEGEKQKFFEQIIALLDPLKQYIKRRLRIAYPEQQVQTPVYTSGDILEQAILGAFDNFGRRPTNLTLEQWLYQITNDLLDRYIRSRQKFETRHRRLEDVEQAERRSMDEIPFTSDAEGEVLSIDDLDDYEYHQRDFLPHRDLPSHREDPLEEIEREEEVGLIVEALSRIPDQERAVFELAAVEGFTRQEVANIFGISPADVDSIVDKVRTEVLQQVRSRTPKSHSPNQKKAS
jgi:RNA polymerase sigma factor (sigma-70 family)